MPYSSSFFRNYFGLLRFNTIYFLFFLCIFVLFFNHLRILNIVKTDKHCNENKPLKVIYNYELEKNRTVLLNELKSYYLNNVPKIEPNLSRSLTDWNGSPQNYSRIVNLFDIVPHLGRARMTPLVEFTKNRKAVMAIGLPTIKREESYLFQTLNSLLSSISLQERELFFLVILVSEFDDPTYAKTTIEKIKETYQNEINNGYIDIIVPPLEFYPDLNNLNIKDYVFNDPPDRIKWRVKQNYDVSFLMNYCLKRAEYYLQLEDDVISRSGFISEILSYLKNVNLQNPDKWKMVEFSELGFIGKVFKIRDLPLFINMFLMFSTYKPVDLIHNVVFEAMACDPAKDFKSCLPNYNEIKIRYTPSLFQHIGVKSSLKGKIQNLRDKNFMEKETTVVKYSNPLPVVINCSIKHYKEYSLESLYHSKTFFWAASYKSDDFLWFKFQTPFTLKKFVIKSGSNLHPLDLIPMNTTFEIKPVFLNSSFNNSINSTTNSSREIRDEFVVLAKFNDQLGILMKELDQKEWHNVSEIRIVFKNSYPDKWLLISEFGLFN